MLSKKDFKTINLFLENYVSSNFKFVDKYKKTDILSSYIISKEANYNDYDIDFNKIIDRLVTFSFAKKENLVLKIWVHRGMMVNLKYIANYLLKRYGEKVTINFSKNEIRKLKVILVKQIDNKRYRVHLSFLDMDSKFYKVDYKDYYNTQNKEQIDFYEFYDKNTYFKSREAFKKSKYFKVMEANASVMDDFFHNDFKGLAPYLKDSFNQSAYDMLETLGNVELRNKLVNIFNPDKKEELKKENREKTIELWNTLKQAEQSGELYIDRKYQNKILNNVHIYDFNSAYLATMKNFPMPTFKPTFSPSKDIVERAIFQFLEVKIEYAKTDFYHFIDPSDDLDKIELAAKIMSLGIKSNWYMNFEDLTDKKEIKDKTLIMDTLTYNYFKKNYKGKWQTKVIITFYKTFNNKLANYADFLMEKKIAFEKEGNKFMRNLIKLMPAIAVGKTATNIYQFPKERSKDLKDSKLVIGDYAFNRQDYKVSNNISYLPFNIAVIVQHKLNLFKLWKEIEADGKRKVIYIDTDSFHIIGEKLPESMIDQYKLGMLKYEGTILKAVYKAYKTYLHIGKESDRSYYKLTAAGLISNFTNETKSLSAEAFVSDDFIIFNSILKREVYPTGDILYMENYHHKKDKRLEKINLDSNILNL